MIIPIPPYSDELLNNFAAQEWEKTLAFLRNRYRLSEEDCEDVFQESFIILHNKAISGELEGLTSSLSTYFTSICINKARETLRRNNKQIGVEDDALDIFNPALRADKIDALLQLETDDAAVKEQQEALVRDIVKKLPSPCSELLWGYFRDNLSMKTLAQMYNYSSESSVKVTKHRCQTKFKNCFKRLKADLFT